MTYSGFIGGLRTRALDLLLSFYLYNEWRGFIQLDRLLGEMRERNQEPIFVESVQRHASDERKHYFLFKQFFVNEKRMPFAVARETGYFDLLGRLIVGKEPESLSAEELFVDKSYFPKLCRAVVVTERRGIKQIQSLLGSRLVKSHAELERIFKIILRDEPFHFLPYQKWLEEHGHRQPGFRERVLDLLVHYGIGLFVFPLLYLSPRLRRLSAFPE